MFSPNIGCQLNPTFILSQIFKWLGYNKCCQYAGINAMAKVLKQKVIATKNICNQNSSGGICLHWLQRQIDK